MKRGRTRHLRTRRVGVGGCVGWGVHDGAQARGREREGERVSFDAPRMAIVENFLKWCSRSAVGVDPGPGVGRGSWWWSCGTAGAPGGGDLDRGGSWRGPWIVAACTRKKLSSHHKCCVHPSRRAGPMSSTSQNEVLPTYGRRGTVRTNDDGGNREREARQSLDHHTRARANAQARTHTHKRTHSHSKTNAELDHAFQARRAHASSPSMPPHDRQRKHLPTHLPLLADKPGFLSACMMNDTMERSSKKREFAIKRGNC